MKSVYEQNGIRPVINASGRMTALGVSTIAKETAEYMFSAASNYVVIDELLDKAGELISPFTGAEDTCVTPNTSAAICLSIAAIMTGKDMAKIERIPDTTGMKNEVIIQKGHCVDYGAPITQIIRTAGAKPVEVGFSNKTNAYSIEGAINENTACLLYVKSHHCVQKGMVSLEDMIKIAHDHNLPIVVDASAEEDLRKYIAMGADVVCYSGAKAIEGPTSGMATGKKEIISAMKLHYKGFGRVMKIGKENMMGLVKAVEIYSNRDEEAHAKMNEEKVDSLIEALKDVNNIKVSKVFDEAGRKICRCSVTILPESGKTAKEVVKELEGGSPAIYTRNHYVNLGTINFDPRPMIDGDVEKIALRLKEILG